jgi:hypothetical protein
MKSVHFENLIFVNHRIHIWPIYIKKGNLFPKIHREQSNPYTYCKNAGIGKGKRTFIPPNKPSHPLPLNSINKNKFTTT